MKRITPQQFKDAFLQAVSNEQSRLLELWYAKGEYTQFVKSTVLRDIGQHIGLNTYSHEYWYLDCIYYESFDLEHFSAKSSFAHYIAVALEHENDLTSTYVEMNRLSTFNTPLKVLITYAQTPAERALYLEHYTKILRAADIFGDFATQKRQLVIFGSENGTTASWHFYVYEASGFQEL